MRIFNGLLFSSNCTGVPQAGYTMFVRFSSLLDDVLSSGDLDGAIENIENVVSMWNTSYKDDETLIKS